ncbi:hypothetical protein [Maricaulis sp.]|jgi:hypothetical protein|uniref:hypothetical protein n=1 Tax=Maricaulis sp. TaxID=1486257 RepID=UPI0025EA19FE|nr:hypothetical protein [Maricaulis sp.]MDF1768158.1 hypothetical protein [Maricaulis sp.]
MQSEWGILYHLDDIRFDAYGRALIGDRAAAQRMQGLLSQADAIACRSGCGAPLSCDTALILREELTRLGPDLLVNNAEFSTIIRKRKAVGAIEAVIVFSVYRRVEIAREAFKGV